MLAALFLLSVVGACAGLAFLSEENVGNMRAKAFEAKRWVALKLDSLGPAPDADTDSDCDLETGEVREAREVLVDNGKRGSVVQLSKPIRPIRRSVHRAQASGATTSTHVTASPSSEYEGLFDRTTADHNEHELHSSQHQHPYQHQKQALPRPSLVAVMSSEGRPGEIKAKALPSHQPTRRGMSFDANNNSAATGNRVHQPNETTSARASFALPRTATEASVAVMDSENPLPAGVAASFGIRPYPGQQGCDSGGSGFGGGDGRGIDAEYQIPEYVPLLQKQGSLSKTTHRRNSSRTMGATADVTGGGGSCGGGFEGGAGPVGVGVGVGVVAGVSGSAERSGRSPPPKILPPVPAFVPGGGDIAPSPPPPPPPPSSSSDGLEHQRDGDGDGGGGGGGGGVEAGSVHGLGTFAPVAVERGDFGPLLSPREVLPRPGGVGLGSAALSPVPLASGRRSPLPTTPKQAFTQQREGPSGGRGSSFFTGPSPECDSSSFSHIDYVAGYIAESMAPMEEGDAGGEGLADGCSGAGGAGGAGDVFWNSGQGDAFGNKIRRGERGRAAMSVLPLSPTWSSEDDLNRGTGVRRRLSPRASVGASVGVSVVGAGVVAGAGRSPRRGVGWASPVSPMSPMSPLPPKMPVGGESSADGGGGVRNMGELGPLALAFSEEDPTATSTSTAAAVVAVAAASPIAAATGGEFFSRQDLRIDVGVTGAGVEQAEGKEVLAAGTPGAAGLSAGWGKAGGVSPRRVTRKTSKTNLTVHAAPPVALAGPDITKAITPRVNAAAATAAATPSVGEEASEGKVSAETTLRRVGLRCSPPIYDRGRNMLGNVEGGNSREGQRPQQDEEEQEVQTSAKRLGVVAENGAGADADAGADAEDGHGQVYGADGRVGTGGVALARAGAVKKDTLAAASVLPAPETADAQDRTRSAASREAEGLLAHAKGEGKHNRRPSGQGRLGRDLSSTDAFSASLDLQFDQLELRELIGGGGFGQVYRGEWRGTPVAIKVLVPVAQMDLNEELAADFRAEVLMLAALRHPNVCLFMGACMEPPNRAIVTELLTRGSLWEALRAERVPAEIPSGLSRETNRCAVGGPAQLITPQGCWPWSVIIKVAEGVACGMWYLHQHEPFPILHRDLKSANLLLDESFNVKICDFGLARLKAFTNSSAMTGNCGTVQWMAPEVLASEKYAEPADVYSFAIVCWEMLSRACPYDGMSQIQVAVAVLNDRLRPEIPEWCPSGFRSLIESGWEQDPSKRPSFRDVLDTVRR